MTFNRVKDPNTMIRIGLISLIVANISQYLLRTRSGFSDSVIDGASGLFFGVAIGSMLLGIWLNTRRRGEGD